MGLEGRKDIVERKVGGGGGKCDPVVYSPVLSQRGLHQIFFPPFFFSFSFFLQGGGAIADAIMAASSAKSLQGLIQIN